MINLIEKIINLELKNKFLVPCLIEVCRARFLTIRPWPIPTQWLYPTSKLSCSRKEALVECYSCIQLPTEILNFLIKFTSKRGVSSVSWLLVQFSLCIFKSRGCCKKRMQSYKILLKECKVTLRIDVSHCEELLKFSTLKFNTLSLVLLLSLWIQVSQLPSAYIFGKYS